MQTYARPVAYIRRSARSRNDPGDNSRGFQTDAIRRRAVELGDAGHLEVLDGDWGKSGAGYGASDKTSERRDFLRLFDEVERGMVTAIYVYDLDRLARSVEWAERLANACERAGTVIYDRRYRYDPADARDRRDLRREAETNEDYSRKSADKRRATVKRQREAGTRLGVAPYGVMPGESIEPIVAAFRKAGSCYGAARILNADGSRTRRGALWTSKVIGDVLERAGVEYRRKPKPGVKAAADWVTFQLLTCHCGNTMTAMDRRSPRVTCYRARQDPTHPRPFGISEAKVLPALMAEAARLRVPARLEAAADDNGARAALAARREGIGDAYTAGAYGKVGSDEAKARMADRLAEVDAAEDQLDARRAVVALPPTVDWTWPPRKLNSVLRALWQRVELGADLMPKPDGFVWHIPEWRA